MVPCKRFFDEVVCWLQQAILVSTELWSCDLFVAAVGYVCVSEMVLTMKWYVMASVSIGFSYLLSKSYRLMTILSFLMLSINFRNDLTYFTMSEFNKFLFLLCALNITDGFDCTYICTIFTILIDSIPRGISILKEFESDLSDTASNIIRPKQGVVSISAPMTTARVTAQTKNYRVDVPRRGAVSAASLNHTISVVRKRRRELEEFVCKSKHDGGFVVSQLRVYYLC